MGCDSARNGLHDAGSGKAGRTADHLHEPFVREHLIVLIDRLGNAIGIKDKDVAPPEPYLFFGIARVVNDADYRAEFGSLRSMAMMSEGQA